MVNCVTDMLAHYDLLCMIHRMTERSCYGQLVKRVWTNVWTPEKQLGREPVWTV